MGYTTEFTGSVTVEPPLNAAEIAYLTTFSETRRMHRTEGPYFVGDGPGFGGNRVLDPDKPPAGQPGLWCNWIPTEDGTQIEWDEGEKFYYSEEWMRYLIDHFLKFGAFASFASDPQFKDFTFDHVVNGRIQAQGEEEDDTWVLVVKDNIVSREDYGQLFAQAPIQAPEPSPRALPKPAIGLREQLAAEQHALAKHYMSDSRHGSQWVDLDPELQANYLAGEQGSMRAIHQWLQTLVIRMQAKMEMEPEATARAIQAIRIDTIQQLIQEVGN